MSDLVEISWSAGSIDEARTVSRFLVQERLCACAQIVPWFESIYLWNDQMETAQESKVFLKTSKSLIPKVMEVIKKNTKYEIPEILWKTLEGGNDEYLQWIAESCHSERENSNKS